MLIGIIFRGLNMGHKKQRIKIALVYIPEFILYMTFIGYLAFLIFVKWGINWEGHTSDAPSLITTLMDFGFKNGAVMVPVFKHHE